MSTENDMAGLGLGTVAGIGTFFVSHYFTQDTKQSLEIALLVGISLGAIHRNILNTISAINGDNLTATVANQGMFGMKKLVQKEFEEPVCRRRRLL